MTNCIFLLGPNHWLDPDDIRSAIQEAPHEARAAVAETLRGRLGLHVVVMEEEPEHPSGLHVRKFNRLIEQHRVQAFLVFLPAGGRLHGVEVECGALLQWLEARHLDPHRVHLLVEDGITAEGSHGPTVHEPGNGTAYQADLERFGCPIRVWRDRDDLIEQAVAAASEVQRQDEAEWWAEALAPARRHPAS